MSDHCNCSWKRIEALLGFLFEFFSNPAWLSMGARCIRINSRELAPLLSHSVRIFATESGDILHGSICNWLLCLQLEHVFSRHLSSSSTRANTTLRCVQACVSARLHYLLTISLVCFFGAGLTCCFFFFPKIGCAPGKKVTMTRRRVQTCGHAQLHCLLTNFFCLFFGAGLACCFFFVHKVSCASCLLQVKHRSLLDG